jgi:hypothetical protein
MRDGSLVSIVYSALGHKGFERERVEVFRGDSVGVIENFRKASVSSPRGGRVRRALNTDRGHRAEIQTFLQAVRGEVVGVPSLDEYVNTTLATFAIEESIRSKCWVEVRLFGVQTLPTSEEQPVQPAQSAQV